MSTSVDHSSEVVFVPKKQTKLQVAELDFDAVMALIPDEAGVSLHKMELNNETFEFNVATIRLLILKRNRNCSCCGIIGNRMFLDLDVQSSHELLKITYQVNLYAESREHTGKTTHLILMQKDHIKPVSKGGSENISNFQTLCYNCNILKSDFDLTIEQMRYVLFPAYRAYKSSNAVRRQRDKNQNLYTEIKKQEGTLRAIEASLHLIKDKEKILEKYENTKIKIECLKKLCLTSELYAQTTGEFPKEDV